MAEARTGEIRPLTSLRFIAALLVFLHHFVPFETPPGILKTIAEQGNMGVSMFFTLSGFLIALIYLPRFEANGLTWAYLRKFFNKRFARVYPLYAAIALLSLVLDDEKTVNGVTGVIHVTLTQSYFLTLPVQLVPTAWSLSVEIGFYLLAPLVLAGMVWGWGRLGDGWRGVAGVAVVLGIMTVALLALGIGLRAFSVANGWSTWRGYGFMPSAGMAIEWTIFGRFAEFAVGMFVAVIYSRTTWLHALYEGQRGMLLSSLLTVIASGGMLYGFHIATITKATQVEETLYAYFVFTAVCTAALIVSLISTTNPFARLLAWEPFVYLGHISYALYLVQMTILMDLARLPLLALLGAAAPLWLYLPLLYLGGNAVSAVLYEWVEVPARRWLLSPRSKTTEQQPAT
ncbi:MAG: acyltransferase [Chloroflexota bacterium]